MPFSFSRHTIFEAMKFIYTAILIPVLGLLGAGCTGTAYQSSENDDLYYATSDRTRRVEYVAPPAAAASETTYATDEVTNPDYAGSSSSGDQNITNNYNYYDSDYGYTRSYRSRSYNSYGYGYNSYDPFYAPYGYSAAYCYGIYDPFWYPGYCPYSTFSVSFGYGYGYPAYGYGYPGYGYYGYAPYRPYGYYGGGYGGYYQGFYDGYYAGNSYGYGYKHRVNYGPRGNRGNVPVNAPAGSTAGRPAPGRMADPNQPGGTMVPGRPMRGGTGQPGTPNPGRAGSNGVNPGTNTNSAPVGRSGMPARPMREQSAQPNNYQFQESEQPGRQVMEGSRPGRDGGRPSQPGDPKNPNPVNYAAPNTPNQGERSGRKNNSFLGAPSGQQQSQPSQERSNRPSRNNSEMRMNDGGGSRSQPSHQSAPQMGGGMSRPGGGMSPGGGGMGRPGR
jgi:hypothetical protein